MQETWIIRTVLSLIGLIEAGIRIGGVLMKLISLLPHNSYQEKYSSRFIFKSKIREIFGWLIISWIKILDYLNIRIYNISLNNKYTVFSFFLFGLIYTNLYSQLLGIFIIIFSAVLWVKYITIFIEKNKLLFFAGAFLSTILLVLGLTLIIFDLFIFLLESLRDIFDLCILWMKWKMTGNKQEKSGTNNNGSGSDPKEPEETILTSLQKKLKLRKEQRKRKEAAKTEQERKDKLAREASRHRERRAKIKTTETELEKKKRIARQRKSDQKWKAKKEATETELEKNDRQARERKSAAESRAKIKATETAQEKNDRQARERMINKKSRAKATETAQERKDFLAREAIRNRERRAKIKATETAQEKNDRQARERMSNKKSKAKNKNREADNAQEH